MISKYLLVDKEILPSYYEKVIEAKSLISSGKAKDVSALTYILSIIFLIKFFLPL
jgi:chorismate mutase